MILGDATSSGFRYIFVDLAAYSGKYDMWKWDIWKLRPHIKNHINAHHIKIGIENNIKIRIKNHIKSHIKTQVKYRLTVVLI